MPPSDFDKLPPEYQRPLSIAREKHNLDVTPLQALTGGRTGAFLYLVSVSVGDFRRVEHLIVKFDWINEKAKPTEVERHRLALSQAPALFANQNMAKLAYEIEHEAAIALFYTIAGQSLQQLRTLASQERQSRLETLFGATNDYLLKEWNAESVFERALHPQKLLERWLGHRLKPGGQIASFLKDTFLLDPDTEGFLIQGQIFPNPWSYGLDTGRQRVRRLGLGTNPGVISFTVSGLILWMLGYPDRAQKRSDDAILLAQKMDHLYSLAYAQFHNGFLNLWLRNPEIAQERAQALLEIAEEHGFQIWSAVGTCLRGAALVGIGSTEMGLALIEKGIDAYRGLKSPPVFWPLLLYLCAGAYRAASRPEEGLVLMKEAIEFESSGSAKTLV